MDRFENGKIHFKLRLNRILRWERTEYQFVCRQFEKKPLFIDTKEKHFNSVGLGYFTYGCDGFGLIRMFVM